MIVAALVILGPLVAAALILALRRGAAAIALGGAGIAAVAALVTLARAAGGERYAATLPGLPGLPLRLVVDPLTATLATVVAVVSLLVLVYAVGYMEREVDTPRFFAGMSFFAAAMQALVLAGDWILLLAAWELIGLTSYLLIGFWHERPGAGAAATRAFLTTRAADLGLYLGAILLIARAGTSTLAPTLDARGATATAASLLLLVAALGKAAQTPFHGWLLDAMAGPTPVSALLHSATLVAAGVILLIRAYPLLPANVLLVVGLAGGLTTLVTGVTALAQDDLKRLLAASTSSQLGFMLLALGAGSPGAATVHLVAHAAMKSALFLGSGIFQQARESTDFDKLAGMGHAHRWTFFGFAVAGLALAGVPPLAGFWTKDAVIAATFASPYRWVLAPLALLGAALTGAYVARALRLLWSGPWSEERRARDEELEAGGDPRPTPVAGLGWMGAGLAALAGLAGLLGLAVRPIERLLEAELPEDPLSLALGLIVAFIGLAGGWAIPSVRLLGGTRHQAAVGFRIDSGFAGIVARPALAFAQSCDRLDRRIHAGVLATGHGMLIAARVAHVLDVRAHAAVEGVGRMGLAVAGASRQADEQGIDGAIGALVRGTRGLGARARRLQTGLVHQELVLAAGGALLLLVILITAGLLGS